MHAEQIYDLPRPHVDSAKNEKSAQLNGLSTEAGLQEKVEGKEHYGVYIFFPFVALLADRSIGSAVNCDLSVMNVHHTDSLNMMVMNQGGVRWEERKPLAVRSEIE